MGSVWWAVGCVLIPVKAGRLSADDLSRAHTPKPGPRVRKATHGEVSLGVWESVLLFTLLLTAGNEMYI